MMMTTSNLAVVEESQNLLKKKKPRQVENNADRRGILLLDCKNCVRYDLMNCFRLALTTVVEDFSKYNTKEFPCSDDYNDVLERDMVTPSGQAFHFTSYANLVFLKMREAIGITEEQYITSLAPPSLPYYEFVSNTKSGQDFYISNDKCYFIKTDTRYYVNTFRSFLGDYIEHMMRYPHTLLVRILGLYSIKLPKQKSVFLIVMQNIFFPDSGIEERFDLKGCSAARYEKPPPPDSHYVHILMDLNFKKTYIDIGEEQKKWLTRQLEIDCAFLSDLGIQDYSFVVGIQDLKEGFYSDLRNQDCEDSDNKIKKCSDVHKEPMLSFYQPRTGAQNIRKLPNIQNAIHILEGEHSRYFIGIVDYFMMYECLQRGRQMKKNIIFCHGDHSTIPPFKYARRFVNFITGHIR